MTLSADSAGIPFPAAQSTRDSSHILGFLSTSPILGLKRTTTFWSTWVHAKRLQIALQFLWMLLLSKSLPWDRQIHVYFYPVQLSKWLPLSIHSWRFFPDTSWLCCSPATWAVLCLFLLLFSLALHSSYLLVTQNSNLGEKKRGPWIWCGLFHIKRVKLKPTLFFSTEMLHLY